MPRPFIHQPRERPPDPKKIAVIRAAHEIVDPLSQTAWTVHLTAEETGWTCPVCTWRDQAWQHHYAHVQALGAKIATEKQTGKGKNKPRKVRWIPAPDAITPAISTNDANGASAQGPTKRIDATLPIHLIEQADGVLEASRSSVLEVALLHLFAGDTAAILRRYGATKRRPTTH